MISEEILDSIAPCGLNCQKCFAHEKGEICEYSRKLLEKLGNFDIYAQRFVQMIDEPRFEKYPEFKSLLQYFASGSCRGCRNEQCRLFRNCGVRACHQEKKVVFCFQCDEFPCDRTGFDEHLKKRWQAIQERIREIGVEAFFKETKDIPRY